jgi:hypothetical protein
MDALSSDAMSSTTTSPASRIRNSPDFSDAFYWTALTGLLLGGLALRYWNVDSGAPFNERA